MIVDLVLTADTCLVVTGKAPDQDLAEIIGKGKNKMPGYEKTLIADVVLTQKSCYR